MKSRYLSYSAWFVVAYTVAVILWGAYVRATGSGAGCGNHWPLCNGEVIPTPEATATLIEFTHRLMTGILLPMVIGLGIWVFRRYQSGQPARLGVILSIIFLLIESLIGAGLVRFELVADNSSSYRALAVSIHLTNTLFLLASMTLTAWWVSGGTWLEVRRSGPTSWALGIALLGLILVGTTGAITALGDTLFPSESVVHGLLADVSPTSSFLVRLRVIHPILAVILGLYAGALALYYGPIRQKLDRPALAWWIVGLVTLQVLLGVTNIILLAPVWLQMLHLLIADSIWIAMVLLTAHLLAVSESLEPVSVVDPLQVPTPT